MSIKEIERTRGERVLKGVYGIVGSLSNILSVYMCFVFINTLGSDEMFMFLFLCLL